MSSVIIQAYKQCFSTALLSYSLSYFRFGFSSKNRLLVSNCLCFSTIVHVCNRLAAVAPNNDWHLVSRRLIGHGYQWLFSHFVSLPRRRRDIGTRSSPHNWIRALYAKTKISSASLGNTTYYRRVFPESGR